MPTCRDCNKLTKQGCSLCTQCFNKRPSCKGCNFRKVGQRTNQPGYYPYCSNCRCFTKDCEQKAVRSGYCQECVNHFTCPQCNTNIIEGAFSMCRECYDKIPRCKCGMKVIVVGDGTYRDCCYRCNCRAPGCTNRREIDSHYCQECAKIYACTSCGKPRSVNDDDNVNDGNEDVQKETRCYRCIKEATYEKCPSGRNCNGLVGFKPDGITTYKYCSRCACSNKVCQELNAGNGFKFCHNCAQLCSKMKCRTKACDRIILSKFTYCRTCNEEYQQGRILCETVGCGNYKSINHPHPYCKTCEDKRKEAKITSSSPNELCVSQDVRRKIVRLVPLPPSSK